MRQRAWTIEIQFTGKQKETEDRGALYLFVPTAVCTSKIILLPTSSARRCELITSSARYPTTSRVFYVVSAAHWETQRKAPSKYIEHVSVMIQHLKSNFEINPPSSEGR